MTLFGSEKVSFQGIFLKQKEVQKMDLFMSKGPFFIYFCSKKVPKDPFWKWKGVILKYLFEAKKGPENWPFESKGPFFIDFCFKKVPFSAKKGPFSFKKVLLYFEKGTDWPVLKSWQDSSYTHVLVFNCFDIWSSAARTGYRRVSRFSKSNN